MELWITTSDVDLRKLVLLEVHGRLRNVKITNKFFSMSKRGIFYIVGKLKRRNFQHAKEHTNQIPG